MEFIQRLIAHSQNKRSGYHAATASGPQRAIQLVVDYKDESRSGVSDFICRLQNALEQHIGAGFTVLPFAVFDFYMAAPADAGDKDHGGGCHLTYIAGVMTGPTH